MGLIGVLPAWYLSTPSVIKVTMTPGAVQLQVALNEGVIQVPAPTCLPTAALIWLCESKEHASLELGAAEAGMAAANVNTAAMIVPKVLFDIMQTSSQIVSQKGDAFHSECC
jgi:hypothetical protein